MIANPKLRLNSDRVRFAVVGLGWIAQEDVLPAFTLKERHYELVALVSGDEKKRDELGKRYGIKQVIDYSDYDDLLARGEVDAVYIALPNRMHAEYSIKAAKAGVHILCEKPMAVTEDECHQMISAADASGVKLMIAYRLHFEEANMTAVERVRRGDIGEPRFFSSVSGQVVAPGNIRLDKKEGYGPVIDMGVYPINAARYLFRSEPVSVTARSEALVGDARFAGVPEMTSVIMRFGRERLGQFIVSFNAQASGCYEIVGTQGSIRLTPAYTWETEIEMTTTIDGKKQVHKFPKSQQFGAEIEYFAKCILEDKPVEPDGLEGLADVRVVSAIQKSAESGKSVDVEPVAKTLRPGTDQVIQMPPKIEKDLVDAKTPDQ